MRSSGFSPNNFNKMISSTGEKRDRFSPVQTGGEHGVQRKTRGYDTAVYQRADVSSKRIFGNHTLCAQFLGDYSGFSTEKVNDILQRAPVDVVEIIVSTIRGLCERLNLTTDETSDLIRKVRDGNMGYLFENMERMDIQLERRNTAEQRERAEEAEKKAEEAEADSVLEMFWKE